MILRELLSDISGLHIEGDLETQVSGVNYDSRKLTSGDLFAALSGSFSDGHNYLLDAQKNKASCLLIKYDHPVPEGIDIPVIRTDDPRRILSAISFRLFGNPQSRLHLIGVTGTNGKTTTTYFIRQLMEKAGTRTGIIGTNGILMQGQLIASPATTPESSDLARIMSEMVANEIANVAMEVSSHALAWGRVDGLQFSAAVFTNLTQDHLDFHKDMEDYFQSKSSLFGRLSPGSETGIAGTAVINTDDPHGRRLVDSIRSAKHVLTYGSKPDADIRLNRIKLSPQGSSFELETPVGKWNLVLPLPGRHNLFNLAASVGVMIGLNHQPASWLEEVSNLSPVPGRMQKIDSGQPFLVLVDYAHTPDALENLLLSVKPITTLRIITVFGCGGDRDRTKRPRMGRTVSQLSDLSIITSDNPRTEDPLAIIQDIMAGIDPSSEYRVIPNRQEAIQKAIHIAHAGDTVVIAGKGHEDYQIIGRVKHPFDDRNEAIKALKQEGYGLGN